ncbi:uncharacterized protein [Parasteatoda tepidariorum]|uniref:uncharacterized protein n=1 Tax=Parasteatoda tepidariorum TaxID=114398 RepID=UPI00077FC8A9|nr:probable DNA-3-methyladenine glycosylase [Parasteatoda tepidariorum]
MSNELKLHQSLSARLSFKVKKRNLENLENTSDVTHKSLKISESEVSDYSNSRLDEQFFKKPCTVLGKSLLGKILCRRLSSGEILKGRVVETECYLGEEDKASHSYQGKITERNRAMFEKPGTVYVYKIYGMYHCFNISSLEEGSAVLIRSIEPLQGETLMQQLRSIKRKNDNLLKHKDLCNGPSKLCEAFKITKEELNMDDLSVSNNLWFEQGSDVSDIIACKRIGIDSCGDEWANKPLRFYVKDCVYVSIRNKQTEKNCSVQDL